MMQRLKLWAGVSGCVLSILLIAGCGSGAKPPPDVGALAPVIGTVTMDGKPLANAMVFFKPDTEKQFNGAFGSTDAAGKYELKTDIGDGKIKPGAPLGKFHVTVSKFVKEDGSSPTGILNDPKEMLGARESIPMPYTTANEERVFEVTAAGGKYDIDIPSK